MKEVILINITGKDKPGLGVAFHAKPLVRQNAHRSISNVGLDGLLYLMGISERDIRQT